MRAAANSSKASAAQKAVAEAFFAEVLASSTYAKATVGAGEVPVIKGATSCYPCFPWWCCSS